MLKSTYKTAEEIPQEHKAFYKEVNGEWVLQVEGMEPASRIEEYRRTNIGLQKERDEQLKPTLQKYTDVGTVDEFLHLKAISDQLDEGKLIRSGKLEEAVEKRMEKVQADHKKVIEKEQSRVGQLEKQLSTLMIDNAVTTEASKLGARPTALPDIVARAHQTIKVEDGKLVFYDKNGQRDYTRAGDDALVEWLKELAPTATHLFEPNTGGGGDSGGGGGAQHQQSSGGAANQRYNGPNPWKKVEGEKSNLTLRMKLVKEQPALAKRLKEEAGVRDTP